MNLNSVIRLVSFLKKETRTDQVPAKVTLSISGPSSEITDSYDGAGGGGDASAPAGHRPGFEK